MNVTTWNQYGANDGLLILLATIGMLGVIAVVVAANVKMNNREMAIRTARRLQSLEPEERVLDDINFGGTDPD